MECYSALLILAFLLSSISSISSQDAITHFCLYEKGNYTANDNYSANLNLIVSSFSSVSKNDYGFYNMSVGQHSDRVNAIALCRGDKRPDECNTCIRTAVKNITVDLCPNLKEAIIWRIDNCMVRYSNREIFGAMETDPSFSANHPNNVTDVEGFNKILRSLLDSLKTTAISGDFRRKYAAGNATGPNFLTIYAQVQCTPDLSELECDDCLVNYFEGLPGCCGSKQGGKIVGPSCYFRFEIYRFYEPEVYLSKTGSPNISTKNTTISKEFSVNL
ncbi:cysteine-rich receptor-like protein kinase 27 [Carica papaya]|uniref:cysteine-rich receptor-like protein kinase 27 n=1 Tax=Carica papaya TaxID=3649 RepID=UPI000B8CCF41|nr:cysteine-rich receptor-like protein kinase 27 [Carica papaya]